MSPLRVFFAAVFPTGLRPWLHHAAASRLKTDANPTEIDSRCGKVKRGGAKLAASPFHAPRFARTSDHGFPIEVGQILTFAQTVERVLEECSNDRTLLIAMAERAADFVRGEYAPGGVRESLRRTAGGVIG